MIKVLTDGEREIITELNADARGWDDADLGETPELSGAWCHGCDNPVEECHCRPRQARRETARRAIVKASELRPVVLRVDNDFFAVASSGAGQGYLLERDPASGDLYCPCKAAEFTGCCYHRAALGLYLGTIPASWLPAPAQAEHVAVAS